ncbi:MAG: hypothetical protein K6E68_06840 [Lachnospiraceae bacterium]|nr:hypothetical protein [Lachnospiraceae bacterium]
MIFKCKNCGGNTIYDPDKGTMCCPHCDGLDSEEKVTGTETMKSCLSCGAPLDEVIGEHTSATRCPNCGSYIILDERVQGAYTPKLIIPFKVSKNKAIDLLHKEFGRRVFTPSSFLSRASVSKIEGTYVPFFMYDYNTDSDYHGTGTKVRTWRSGQYEYTETSYFDIHRELEADFDKVPVDASDYMDDQCMDLMEPYDYAALEGFMEKYMSGYLGEKYNRDEEELASRAVKKLTDAIESMIGDSISGYATVSKKSLNVDAKKKLAQFALLPVWEYVFSYGGEDYRFFVNGQTGKVVGRTPVAKGKVFAYGATVFGVIFWIMSMIRLLLAAFV